MEYTVRGAGQPVLLIHGTSGGIRQGLLLAERLGDGFRFIIPARFGYCGTPLPGGGASVPAALIQDLDRNLHLLSQIGQSLGDDFAGMGGEVVQRLKRLEKHG